ncbi:MAG: Ig-like domain-containing protein [Muribaculaceae bacterium]|nr:Ig-like domain-containing protein [Muribaculaceae bacterium]
MKFTRLLLPVLLLAGISVTAKAQDSTEPQTITYTVSCDEGVLTGSGNYRSTWTSSVTEAGIQVVSNGPSGNPANNFENTDTGWLKLNTGKPAPTTVVIDPVIGGKWYVSHYSFKAVYNTTVTDLKLAIQGRAAQSLTSGVEFPVDEVIEKGETASFVFSGTNGNPITLKDFTVTITLDPDYVEPPYELPVEADLIVNGKFDEWTTWYNLQIGVNGYKLYNNGSQTMSFTADDKVIAEDDDHLWAFVVANEEAHTVKIYNRATGVGKVLAAKPGDGNNGKAVLVDEGTAGYCDTWIVTTAETKKDGTAIGNAFNGKRTIYITLSENEDMVLNCYGGANGNLGFWANYDDNSVVVPIVIESKFPIDMAHGYLRRTGNNVDPTNRWQGIWTYSGAMNIKFETNFNNLTISDWSNPQSVDEHPDAFLQLASNGGSNTFSFTIPQDYYISDFSVDVYCPQESGETNLRITSGLEDRVEGVNINLSGTKKHHIEMTDMPHDYIPQFITTGDNYLQNNVVLENFTATVRRYVRTYESPVNVFPRNAVDRQIRIPAITTVGAGEHEGRLIAAYDYRWCNGDLGGGNIDLTIASSDDNGVTWTAPGFAYDADGNPVTEYNHQWTKGNDWATVQSNATEAWDAAWGDAALCADRESQTVMMIAVGGPTGFWGSRRNNAQSAIRWISHDGGTTWSAPMNITEKIYSLFDGEPRNGLIDGMFFGSGRAMQSRYIKVGDYYRVYSVISSQNGGNNTRNWVLYTDDMGENWNILGSYAQCPVASNADEPKAEELPDGSVLLAARARSGNRNFNIFRYTNPTTGEGKWIGNHVNTNMGMGNINACDGEIFFLPAKNIATGEKCFMALQSFPYGGSRQMVSIAWKRLDSGEDFDAANDFTTWGGRYQVCGGDAAYSTMSLMPNGHLAFFYEEGLTGTYDGVFKELSLELITDGLYTFYPDHENAVAQKLTKSLVEYRMEHASADKEDAMTEAGNAYLENPTYANYIKFNRAEYGEPASADDYDFPYEDVAIWPGAATADELKITPASLALKVGDTASLSASTSKEVAWTSSNELVATVDNGVVTAVGVGNAIITAATQTKTATCTVTVEPAEGSDAILEINGEGKNIIYDLQGRRVIKASKGLYIVNGELRNI